MFKKIALLLLLIAPMSLFAQKFGHIKSMDIVTVMPEYTKAQTDIQAMQKQANLPKNIQDRRQKELQDLSEKGMQFQQDAQQQLQKSYATMMEPIYKKVEDAIKAVGVAAVVSPDKFVLIHCSI